MFCLFVSTTSLQLMTCFPLLADNEISSICKLDQLKDLNSLGMFFTSESTLLLSLEVSSTLSFVVDLMMQCFLGTLSVKSVTHFQS